MFSFEAARDITAGDFVPEPSGQEVGFRPAVDGPLERLRAAAEPAPAPAESDADTALARLEEHLAAEYERGCATGRDVAESRIAGPLAALTAAAQDLDALRGAYLRDQRDLLIELAVSIAEQIVARELRADSEALASCLERAIAALPGDGPVVVELSTGDHEVIAEHDGAELGRLAAENRLRVESTAELSPGEARVSGAATRIDVSAESLVAAFREALQGLDAQGIEPDACESSDQEPA